MEKEKHNIDKLFKENLQEHKIDNTTEDIIKMAKNLKKFNFTRFGFNHFNIYLIGIFAALTISSFIIIKSMDSNNNYGENNIQTPDPVNKKDNNTNEQEHIIQKKDKTLHSEEIKAVENKKTVNQIYTSENSTRNKETKPNDQDTEPDDTNIKSSETEHLPIDTIVKYVKDTIYTFKKVVIHDTVKKVIHKPVPRKNK